MKRRAIMYHKIEDGRYGLDLSLFEWHCELIKNKFVDTLITFDDGDETVMVAADILDKYNLQATFFVITDMIGQSGFVNEDQIKELHQRGHVVGSHGHTHRFLNQLDDLHLKEELVSSKKILEDILAVPIKDLSFPGGRFNTHVLDIASQCGYEMLWSSEPGHWKKFDHLPRQGRDCLLQGFAVDRLENLLNGQKDGYRSFRYRTLSALKAILGDNLYHRWTVNDD